MTIFTEGARKADFLVSEANDWRSRDEVTVTVPANTTLEAGTVLATVTSSGKFVRHDTDLSNGGQDETGILFANLVNDTESAVDHDATVIVRDAEVNGAELTYEDGADDTAKAASNTALASLGIIVR